MKFIKRLFKLPSPKDLGLSKYNALPMRDFDPNCEGPTWEDYHELVAKKFPIKNFFANTLADFFKYKVWYLISVPYDAFEYYLISHLVPSRRYHMLDLRQPCKKDEHANYDCYRYGWTDVPEKMLYAMFNLLKEYFDEDPYDLSKDYSLEEIEAEPILKRQYNNYQEAKLLLHWWQVERKEELDQIDKLLHEWSELKKNTEAVKNGTANNIFLKHTQAQEAFENKTNEMCIRLLKIRNGLWT